MSIFCKSCKYYQLIEYTDEITDQKQKKTYMCMKDIQPGKDRCEYHRSYFSNSDEVIKWIKEKINDANELTLNDKIVFIMRICIYFIFLFPNRLGEKFTDTLLSKLEEVENIDRERINYNLKLIEQAKYLKFILLKFKEYKENDYDHWSDFKEISFNKEGKKLLKNLF